MPVTTCSASRAAPEASCTSGSGRQVRSVARALARSCSRNFSSRCEESKRDLNRAVTRGSRLDSTAMLPQPPGSRHSAALPWRDQVTEPGRGHRGAAELEREVDCQKRFIVPQQPWHHRSRNPRQSSRTWQASGFTPDRPRSRPGSRGLKSSFSSLCREKGMRKGSGVWCRRMGERERETGGQTSRGGGNHLSLASRTIVG